MKLILILITLTGCATKSTFKPYDSDKNPLTVQSVMKNIKFKEDEFKNKVFLIPNRRNSDSSYMYDRFEIKPYIGIDTEKKNSLYTRIVFDLNQYGWMFMNEVHFKCGKKDLKIKLNNKLINRQIISGGNISETTDMELTSAQFSYLKKCKTGDKYRVSGKREVYDTSWKIENETYFKEMNLLKKHIKKNGHKSLKPN